ncbi:alpha/beta hydrolase [Bacillus massiliigorillae]|uniref:alpha/beta hydrolase n=1 Tax=Bacillus massiliigorillae TaxID=1243664 RepID=UPI0003A83083|nr:alpha/beta hydrolase-fold protein [Bacillus massiliigorillae]
MQNTEYTFQIASKATEYEYTIQVYVPNENPPKEGFPIIYVLDGLYYFDFAKNVVKLQSLNTLKTKIEASIVVGVCHHEKDMRERRFFEFTAPAKQYIFPEHAKGKKLDLGKNGGASLFHQFIENELKVTIEGMFNVNNNKQTLYGHSLAGYYTLWCYLTHCYDFQNYIAISPSIWWNGKELYQYLEKANHNSLQKLYIAVGECEGFMVEDAKIFYDKIPTVAKDLYIALGENHSSVVPTTMSKSFRFVNNIN